MMNLQLYNGTGHLIKIIAQGARLQIIAWVLGIVIVSIAVASSYQSVYQNPNDKQAFAMTMQNPAMVAMLGPGYEVEEYLVTTGTQFAHEMLLFSVIAVAIMNILLVGSATRTDEETGRIEVIRSLPVGRLAYLAACLIVVGIVNVVLILLVCLGIYVLNIDGVTFESALLYGANLGAGGFIFGAVTAMFAQLSETSRGTMGLAFGALITAYIIRAVGDVGNENLALVSPLGWLLRSAVFIDNYWWPIVTSIFFTIILVFITFYLNSIRDLGSGFLPSGKGKTNASSFKKTTFGLILHLQKVKIMGWGIAIFALGAVFGAVMGDMELYFKNHEFIQMMLAQMGNFSITEQFISMLISIMSLISLIPVIMTILKLKSEENHSRTEHFYSRSISRNTVLGSITLMAVIESIFYLLLLVLGLWLGAMTMMEEPVSFSTVLQSALVYLPAIWFMIGITILLVGVAPKLTSIIWLYYAFCYIVAYVGGMLNFPNWLLNLSVFESIPKLPGEEINLISLIMIMTMSCAILLVGFYGYKKRDIVG